MQLHSSLFQDPAISHGFFTRNGGVSDGIYSSLNCGWGSGDDPGNIRENRFRASEALGAKELLSMYQVHGIEVVTVTEPWKKEDMPKADAMVTNRPGIVLGILTADCVPVLFADEKAKVIGAAHAGWKGAIGNIMQETIKAMQALGAKDIIACIGPCIGQQSYEVGPEYVARFIETHAENARFFAPGNRPGYHYFDIGDYVASRLKEAGLTRIETLARDTCLEEDSFFSFRRATLRGEKDYGRQLSAIVIK